MSVPDPYQRLTAKEALRAILPVAWDDFTPEAEYDAALTWLSHGLEKVKSDIDWLETIYDIDNCPEAYLPYVAYTVGLTLEYAVNSNPNSLRQQIKDCVAWYRLKGTVQGIKLMFLSLGFQTNIKELWYGPDYDYNTLTDIKPAGYSPYTPDGGSKSHFFDVDIVNIDDNAVLAASDTTKVKRLLAKVKPLTTIMRNMSVIKAMSDVVDPIEDECTVDPEFWLHDTFVMQGNPWCLYYGKGYEYYKYSYMKRDIKGTLLVEQVAAGVVASIPVDGAQFLSPGDEIILDVPNRSPLLRVDHVVGNDVFLAAPYNDLGDGTYSAGSQVFKLTFLYHNNFDIQYNNQIPVDPLPTWGDTVIARYNGDDIANFSGLSHVHPNSHLTVPFLFNYSILSGWDFSCGGQNYHTSGHDGDALEFDVARDLPADQFSSQMDSVTLEGSLESSDTIDEVTESVAIEVRKGMEELWDWGEEITFGLWSLYREVHDSSFNYDGAITYGNSVPLIPQRTYGDPQIFTYSGDEMFHYDGEIIYDGAESYSGFPTYADAYDHGWTYGWVILSGLTFGHRSRGNADNLSISNTLDFTGEVVGISTDSLSRDLDFAFSETVIRPTESLGVSSNMGVIDVWSWGETITNGIWEEFREPFDGSFQYDGALGFNDSVPIYSEQLYGDGNQDYGTGGRYSADTLEIEVIPV